MEIKLYLYISSIREESDQKYLFNRTQNSRQMGIRKILLLITRTCISLQNNNNRNNGCHIQYFSQHYIFLLVKQHMIVLFSLTKVGFFLNFAMYIQIYPIPTLPSSMASLGNKFRPVRPTSLLPYSLNALSHSHCSNCCGNRKQIQQWVGMKNPK